MSEQVKRYHPEGYSRPASISGAGTHMIESRDGDYVLASDFEVLAQRCRELEVARNGLAGQVAQLTADKEEISSALMLYKRFADEHDDTEKALRAENEDLFMALQDAEHRANNAGRNASAFEDRMGDLQVANGKLLDEVADLKARLLDVTKASKPG